MKNEKFSFNPEQRTESLEQFEHQQAEHLLPTHEQSIALERQQNNQAAEARQSIVETTRAEKETPNPLERVQAAEKAPQAPPPTNVTQQLKNITLQRELQSIRRRLPASQRTLSKVIHQPVVRAVSEVAGKTVSRPSGLLGGGVLAFIGTTGYLYLTKHMGMRYNYSVFIALFLGGFALGLIIELTVNLATRKRIHSA